MKNNDSSAPKENEQQNGQPIKEKDNKALSDHSPAVSTKATDAVKNTASEAQGLNQERTDNNELEPGTNSSLEKE